MNKINYKLINIFLIIITLFFIYKLFPLISFLFLYIKKLLGPIFISFIISYAIYPLVLFFRKRKLNNNLSVFLSLILIIIVIFLLLYFSLPLIIKELNILLKELIKYIPNLLELNLPLFITNFIEKSVTSIGNNIYEVGFSTITKSVNFIINLALIIIMTVALLMNMEKLRGFLRKNIKNKNIYYLISKIDNDLYNYIKSISIIIVIETIEYTIIYLLVGHPYYYLLGILAGITTIIPYFGALWTNLIAFITAINVSDKLFIMTAIIAIVIPILDNYLIDPKIMSKTTKLSFLEITISIIISSSFFGFIGFIIAVPLYIIFNNIVKFYLDKRKLK